MGTRYFICFYHQDADGRCSAAIVRRALGADVESIPVDYGDRIPWHQVERAEKVFVVDFSFSLEEMERIQSSAELIWIDHHISALSELEGLKDIPGIRETDQAACVLTWKYFYPDEPVPRAVLYVGDRDTWKHEYPETRPFGEGLYYEDSVPENDDLWIPLLEGDSLRLEELIERGELLYSARMKRSIRVIERRGLEVQFEGHRTLMVNAKGTGDLGEMIRHKGYEVGYCYTEAMQNEALTTFVTLYSDSVDVSKIAEKFGGGGHQAAAGFSFVRTSWPFPPGSDATLNPSLEQE